RRITLLQRARQAYPADFWLNCELAHVVSSTNPPDWNAAIRYYTAAAAVRPESPGARINVGFALEGKGLIDEAAVEYREAVRLKPDYLSARNNLGSVLCDRKKDFDGAMIEFDECIRLAPKVALYHFNLGNALRGKGRWDAALAKYRDAIDLNPDFAEAH